MKNTHFLVAWAAILCHFGCDTPIKPTTDMVVTSGDSQVIIEPEDMTTQSDVGVTNQDISDQNISDQTMSDQIPVDECQDLGFLALQEGSVNRPIILSVGRMALQFAMQ